MQNPPHGKAEAQMLWSRPWLGWYSRTTSRSMPLPSTSALFPMAKRMRRAVPTPCGLMSYGTG